MWFVCVTVFWFPGLPVTILRNDVMSTERLFFLVFRVVIIVRGFRLQRKFTFFLYKMLKKTYLKRKYFDLGINIITFEDHI